MPYADRAQSAWPYSYEILDVNRLTVDESYQRPLTTFAGRIERSFDPALVGTLVVSRRRDGDLAVIDGWTRATAITRLVADGTIPEPGAPCIVYEGLSRADEASLFARLQKERRGISSYHRFRAAVVAGEEEAVAIQAIVECAGHQTGVGKDVIGAVAALERVYRRGPKMLERTFAVLCHAWGAEYVPAAAMLRGVGRLLDTGDGIDDGVLAQRLKPWNPERLKRLALEDLARLVTFRPLERPVQCVHQRAPFSAGWTSTVSLLAKELRAHGARQTVLEVDMRESDMRLDGLPRADRHAKSPGIVLSFEATRVPGKPQLRYEVGTFSDWRANLRAVALGLEALRAVDRYGITRCGEQYAGWKQLAAGAGPSAERGRALIREHGSERAALMATHPDHGGDAAAFADGGVST